MHRHAPALLSAALLASAYALYRAQPDARQFTLDIQTARGVQSYSFARRPDADTERILTAHQVSRSLARPGNPVVRWDNNWLGSNAPCEDRWATDLVSRRPATDLVSQPATRALGFWKHWYAGDPKPDAQPANPSGKHDLVLFSVFDGHAGHATSTLLQQTLHPTLASSLANLHPAPPHTAIDRLAAYLSPSYWLGQVWSPETVNRTIQNAYLQLDENICQTPVRLLPLSTGPTARQTLVALAQPAASGACAITTLVDAENDNLHIALAGDCRAVAGWQAQDGSWRCDVLTEDQMGDNPREVKRMQNEHPPRERDTVIRHGRVQGGLQPTRAFGDAVYKWTNEQSSKIAQAFTAENEKPRASRPYNYTPPYVTARPEMTFRKIHPESGEKLKFIIMATDGLWDRITSEEATLLLASYLSHPTHSPVYKASLPKLFPLAPPLPPSHRLYPAQDLPAPDGETWVYEGDPNAATHLIRNSLAGGDLKWRGELLSLSGKVSRWMRDDITVTVVLFDDQQ